MREHGSYYMYNEKELVMTQEEFKAMKTLKSSRMKSGYIEEIIIWKEKDNPHINCGRLATLLHFFFRMNEMPEDFIKRHNVKKYHVDLMNSMYFEYEDYDDGDGTYASIG